jgi:hypothetical protein
MATQYGIRADPQMAIELAYLRQTLAPLVDIRIDTTMLVRVAVSTLVRYIDDIREIDDTDTRTMRELLLANWLRNAGHLRDSLVKPGDLETNPERTFRRHQKEALERLKGTR